MCQRRNQALNRLLCIGLLLLPVANVTRFLLERHSSIGDGPRDGIFGFVFGIALGCALLGMWRMKRAGDSTGSVSP